MLQFQSSPHTMSKKSGNKKAKVTEGDSDVEIISRIDIIYQATKVVTRVEQEFKWGQIYHMIKDQDVPDVGL